MGYGADMIRIGGQGNPGELPPHDPEEERKLANWAVAGNAFVFAAVVAGLTVLPNVLEPLGFQTLS